MYTCTAVLRATPTPMSVYVTTDDVFSQVHIHVPSFLVAFCAKAFFAVSFRSSEVILDTKLPVVKRDNELPLLKSKETTLIVLS